MTQENIVLIASQVAPCSFADSAFPEPNISEEHRRATLLTIPLFALAYGHGHLADSLRSPEKV